MNAISLYVSATRLLFQPDLADQNFSDLYRLVPYLRQSLSCTVCANLLVEPFSPQDVCQHHVCRNCIGGRKNLKPTCTSCRDYQNYQANTQLRILLQCYKTLCKYILTSPLIYSSMHKHLHVAGFMNGNNEAHSLAELIDEGARFYDDYRSNSGLPKSAFSILPCIFAPPQNTHKNKANQSSVNHVSKLSTTVTPASSAMVSAKTVVTTTQAPHRIERKEPITLIKNTSVMPNPPIKTVSNGSALYSVMYAGSGNKITIKRKIDDSLSHSNISMGSKAQTVNVLTSSANRSSAIVSSSSINTSSNASSSGTTVNAHTTTHQFQHQHLHQQQPQSISVSQMQAFKKPTTAKATKTLQKRKGCRCGNATPTPGKLTCCGQRCPCYVDSKSCVDCKCRGCRNPHRIDGFKVRPQIPELTCFVQMSNDNYIDIPVDAFSSSSSSSRSNVKHTDSLGHRRHDGHTLLNSQHQQMELENDSIEYIPNELDEANIQVVNVYTTTHLADVTPTLPTIIMQESPSANAISNTSISTTTKLSLPSPEPTSYSLFGDDIMTHSFSDEACSSEDRSDVEIDI